MRSKKASYFAQSKEQYWGLYVTASNELWFQRARACSNPHARDFQVYEVFGPVTRPFYSVRLNSAEDIPEGCEFRCDSSVAM